MGTWGPGLFADDDVADLRGDYRTYLADAQSDGGATDLAARDYGADLDRPSETTAFWLGLASIQWRMGRIDPRVKSVCMTIVDDGIDLEKWSDSPDRGKRAAVLAKLRAMILSPLPPAKPVPKPLPVQLPGWAFGEVVGYRMANGKYALLHALNYRVLVDGGGAGTGGFDPELVLGVGAGSSVHRSPDLYQPRRLSDRGTSPALPRHATRQGALLDAVRSIRLVEAGYTGRGHLGGLWLERTRGW